ncbi:MAG: hypothetical protein PSV43_02080, partial [Prosthecobacter sp.]|nr:hypothetical protein [Prosthecobacter sp.]
MKPEQITAWALDEASTEERQQLEAKLLENPNDKQKADETKAFCDFLLTELRDDSLALTDKQRERLVAQASSAAPSPAAPASPLHSVSGVPPLQAPAPRTTRWNIGVIVRLSLAACAVLGGFWTWQAYSSKQSQARAVAAVASVAEKPAIKVQLASKPEPKKKAGQGPEALLAATPVKPVIVAELPAAKPLSPLPKTEPAAAAPALALTKDQRAMTPGDVTRLKQIQDQHAYGLSFGGKPLAGLPPPATQTAPPQGLAVSAAGSIVQAGTGVTTQKMEPSAAGASLVLTGSGVLTSADNSMVQQRPDMMARNGGGAMIVADADFASPARSLPVSPRADANSPG